MMRNLVKASLKVNVKAFDRVLKENANVQLVSVTREKKEIKPEFEKLTGLFVVRNIQPGLYTVTVESKGYESQQREITLNSGEHEETFILGKKGMPFYYRGKVKVPFESDRKLIGVTLQGKDVRSHEKVVTEAAQRLGLSRIETGNHIYDNGVLVFSINKKDDDRTGNDEIMSQVENIYGVKYAGPVIRIDKQSVTFLTRQVIVKFKPEIVKDKVPGIAREYGCMLVRHIPYLGNGWLLQTLKPASFDILDICEKLVNSKLVEYAEPNMAFTVVDDFTPNDYLYPQQGHHAIIGSEAAWDITRGDNSIVISVVDSGFDISHPDFQNPAGTGWTKIYSPFDFAGMDANPLGADHGVESSGIAAAVGNNSEGIAGMAQNCVLLPVRRSGGTDLNFSDMYIWIAGFDPASTTAGFPAQISPGADVISNSFGAYEAAISGIMKDTFDYLTTYGRNGKGCVVVYSVGNDDIDFNNGWAGGAGRQWAAYSRTIAVAASTISPPDASEIKSSTSNFGLNLDVCAPAGNSSGTQTRSISSYNVGGGSLAGTAGGVSHDYGSFGQTSCACPEVAGTAALMLSVNPDLTWIEVRQILRDTAGKIDFANVDPTGRWVDLDGDGVNEYSQWYGYGRLDAAAAVTGARDFVANSDILVRDNLADTGTVPSTGAFWASPDVWVRTSDPAADGAAALPANYLSSPPHEDADRTHDNWVYVRFKNIGVSPSNSFYIRVYIAHWAGTEFVFPQNFTPTNHPGDPIPSPMTPGTYLIGETLINSMGGGAEQIVNMLWEQANIPPDVISVGGVDVHWHPCLLVQVTPADGPLASGNHVWDSNNLAQRNISIIGADDVSDDFAVATIVGNIQNSMRILELEIDRGKLPSGVQLYMQIINPRAMEWIEKNQKQVVSVSYKTGRYKGRKVLFLDPKEKIRIPVYRGSAKLIPVVVGAIINSKAEKGTYDIVINQYDYKDNLSGSYGIQLIF
jgi:subtilisin family serine protease